MVLEVRAAGEKVTERSCQTCSLLTFEFNHKQKMLNNITYRIGSKKE